VCANTYPVGCSDPIGRPMTAKRPSWVWHVSQLFGAEEQNGKMVSSHVYVTLLDRYEVTKVIGRVIWRILAGGLQRDSTGENTFTYHILSMFFTCGLINIVFKEDQNAVAYYAITLNLRDYESSVWFIRPESHYQHRTPMKLAFHGSLHKGTIIHLAYEWAHKTMSINTGWTT
jgi:hypothetical protein